MSPAAPTEQVPTSTYAYRVPGGEAPGDNPQEPRKRGWLRWVVLLVILALAGLITWRTITAKREAAAAAAKKQHAMANLAVPVQVAPVRQETVPIYLTGLGTVTPYYSVKIIPRVTGELTNVYFREGQDVRKGAELMTIDPRPYQATLDQAKGQLARDQAQLQNNQAEFNRYKALYDQGVVSKEQSDSMQSNLGQFVGAIKSDQASIESAQLNVTYCHIKSPMDGKVGLRLVDPGNLVTANTTQTLIVNQFRPIAVYFTLPEDQLQRVLSKLRQDHKLDAIAFDRSDTTQLETGQLTAADNQIDTTTGTDKLKAVFENADEKLFPNQFVNVHLVLEQRKNAIVVPAAAIQHGTDNDYVWLVKPDTNARPANSTPANPGPAEQPSARSHGSGAAAGGGTQPGNGTVVMQPVDIDTAQGSMVILKSGLEANQQVVVDGADKLQNGSKVSTTAAVTHRVRKQQQQQLGPS
ncbi:MAG: rane fusion protein multidrug efflux system [Acidobacteriaceae bacterium]|jgi:multidrug efflux system membrane fusion protein|nr:rane fusion protein multidrug efflux system [Acidobacteriaceae bacterium]